jgi:N-acetylmuramoyl-L-alanine amidase
MTELFVRHVLILTLAGVLALVLRRQSAAHRHALWAIALVVCILLPALQRVPIPIPVLVAQSLDLEGEPSWSVADRISPVSQTMLAAQSASLDSRNPWMIVAWGVYLAVAAALVLRWGIGWRLAARLARNGKMRGKVQDIPVVAVDRIGPLTFGWPSAVIIVPHMDFDLNSPVIRHELAHIRRADFVWQGLGILACALWWFSPAVWLAARMMRREAERACDDMVLSQGASAPDYAESLLEIASMKSRSFPLAASLVAALPAMRRGDLANRITSMLTLSRNRSAAKPLALIGLVAILLPAGLHITRPVLAAGSAAAATSYPDGTLRGKMIVLDPGHGGHDPGARSGDQKESYFNLAIAQRAAELLRKEGAIVTLTRHDDTYLDLRRRATFSRGQDLYLSIHVDSDRASPNENRPFPVQIYSYGAAYSPQHPGATHLAQALVSAANAPPRLVAPQVQVRAAKYAVLRNAECPAYLVSFGKITNRGDLTKLRDPTFLDRLSRSLVDGARAILK